MEEQLFRWKGIEKEVAGRMRGRHFRTITGGREADELMPGLPVLNIKFQNQLCF